MKDFMELCMLRRSCRKYADRPVEREKLTKCVEAARLAPSACNSQPWSFVVVDNPEMVAKIAENTPMMGANAWSSSAKAFIAVVEEHAVLMPALRSIFESQYYAKWDLGAAAAMICLQAADLELGTCIMGVFDREKIYDLLGIPTEKQLRVLIAVGYPESAAEIRPKNRKPLEEIARYI